jgi:hypothetical protein
MTMRIFETFDRDPRHSPLANNGQARITFLSNEHTRAELRAELETFVCDGQYGDAIQRILQGYLTHHTQSAQIAAWVAGYFGSGKSHLQKIMGHLWANTDLGSGVNARSLVRSLPDDVVAQLKELDNLARKSGEPLMAASGAMPSGARDAVRLTVLSILLRAKGLPEQYAQARFCFWLREQGYLEAVRHAVEEAGKDWFKELKNLYVSGVIAQAVMAQDANFAADERKAREVIKAQFPPAPGDITTAQFIAATRSALAPDGGELPHTILVLDEVQQYIGDSNDRATTFVELSEAIQKELDSRVLLVASGQSALSSTPQLQKLKDRFRISVQLSDADVEAVIRKVILLKKASAQSDIQTVLEANAGEVSKQLQDTTIRERPEDRDVCVADYPLLPTRRRFWEACFRSVDAAGTNSQLRSQLRIIYDAVKDVADAPLGTVITADVLYEAMAPDLVNSGVLLNEINNRISSLADGTEEGSLRKSLCGLAFLISRLPRDPGVDLGLRATSRTLADLMVADLRADSGPLRQRVNQALKDLAEDGTLMPLGDEYRLQTTEGAIWDGVLREKQAQLRNDEGEIVMIRERLLSAAVEAAIRGIRLSHGDAKVPRKIDLRLGIDQPAASLEDVVVWLRDGWQCKENDVLDAARQAGASDPMLHVFLPKKSAEELRSRIIESEAAQRVLHAKGVPSTAEGKEAKAAMESRQQRAEQERNELITDILASAKVFKGGGAEELAGITLTTRVQAAAEAALARLFPEFDKGDHTGWGTAVTRAKQGSDSPLEAVGHKGSTESHPVAKQVLDTIRASTGSEADGAKIRKELKGAPYGWPQDAIDAVLMALHGDGTLRCTDNGNALVVGKLDQQSITKVKFVPEKVRLSATQKLALRGIYQSIGIQAKPGQEESDARLLLQALESCAAEAGGEPPLPAPPSTGVLQQIRLLAGPEQLLRILESKETIQALWTSWKALAERAEQRLRQWRLLTSLLAQAQELDIHAEVAKQLEAIELNRSLLDPQTNYVEPLLKRLEEALREQLSEAQTQCIQAQQVEAEKLESSTEWQQLSSEQQDAIVCRNKLDAIEATPPVDLEALEKALKGRSLASWGELADSLPARYGKARTEAIKIVEPTTCELKLSSGVLKDAAAVEEWIEATRTTLLSKVIDGPIQIS